MDPYTCSSTLCTLFGRFKQLVYIYGVEYHQIIENMSERIKGTIVVDNLNGEHSNDKDG